MSLRSCCIRIRSSTCRPTGISLKRTCHRGLGATTPLSSFKAWIEVDRMGMPTECSKVHRIMPTGCSRVMAMEVKTELVRDLSSISSMTPTTWSKCTSTSTSNRWWQRTGNASTWCSATPYSGTSTSTTWSSCEHATIHWFKSAAATSSCTSTTSSVVSPQVATPTLPRRSGNKSKNWCMSNKT